MGSLSFLVVGSIQAFSVERLRGRGASALLFTFMTQVRLDRWRLVWYSGVQRKEI